MAATLPVDDRDLDDAALWAVIDSAAATVASYPSPTTAFSRSHSRKPLTLTTPNFHSPPPPPPPSTYKSPRSFNSPDDFRPPQKIQRSSPSCISPAVKHWPINPVIQSPQLVSKELSPFIQQNVSPAVIERCGSDDKENFKHCLSGRFPTVSLFKDYQDTAMAEQSTIDTQGIASFFPFCFLLMDFITQNRVDTTLTAKWLRYLVLEKSDYTMISGNPFIKKSGWRKIAFYFNVSFEIKDKTIEFDDNRNVQRAEFVVRAHMQGGRFSDGWGSCERREKKFIKPNNDIPSTAETRAKNKACQDLIGIGQYRPGASHSHFPSPR